MSRNVGKQLFGSRQFGSFEKVSMRRNPRSTGSPKWRDMMTSLDVDLFDSSVVWEFWESVDDKKSPKSRSIGYDMAWWRHIGWRGPTLSLPRVTCFCTFDRPLVPIGTWHVSLDDGATCHHLDWWQLYYVELWRLRSSGIRRSGENCWKNFRISGVLKFWSHEASKWRGYTRCVPRVSLFVLLKHWFFQLELDTCHPSDWAMCPLLVFCHVAPGPKVQRLGTPEELCCWLIESRTPGGRS